VQAAAGPRERATANIAAISTMRDVAARETPATEDELVRMRAFGGWGGCSEVFSDDPAWHDLNETLRGLLSEDEYAAARSSVLTAYYTPQPVVEAIWHSLSRMGIGTGTATDHVLEPGCGTGNFLSTAPDTNVSLSGVEVDPLSAQLAAALNPTSTIVEASLEDCFVTADSYDAVVGNVPYSADITMPYKVGTTTRPIPIHDYFLERSVDAVRPGGVVCVLTSRYTLDKGSKGVRQDLAEKAELVGVVRLPEGTFSVQAGTKAATDLIVLRRRERRVTFDSLPSWVETTDVGRDGTVLENSYLIDHPECVIGTVTTGSGRFGETLQIRSDLTVDDIGRALDASLERQLSPVGDIHESMGERGSASPAICTLAADFDVFSYKVGEDGTVWLGTADGIEPVIFRTERERERVVAMVALRDTLTHTYAVEHRTDDSAAHVVADAISALDAQYESFVERFGRISDRANSRAYDHTESGWFLLAGLENTNAKGEFVSKTDVLSRRVVSPVAPMPEHLDDAADALAVSMDRLGHVDVDLVASLLSVDAARATELLGDSVVADPDTGGLVLANDYLSGDVVGKAEHVRLLADEVRNGAARARHDEWLAGLGIPTARASLMADRPMSDETFLRAMGGDWWGALVHPYDIDAATDVKAAADGWYSEASAAGILTLLDELVPGCALTTEKTSDPGRDGLGAIVHSTFRSDNFLWKQTLPSGRHYGSHGPIADANPLDKAVLMQAVLSCGSLSVTDKRGVVASLCDVMNYENYTPEFKRDPYAAAAMRACGCADFESVAAALIDRPELGEYLVEVARTEGTLDSASVDLRDVRGTILHAARLRGAFYTASEAGFAAFTERRRDFLSDVPAVDEARARALDALAGRLDAVTPLPVGTESIRANLGAAWIPARDVYDFMREVLCGENWYPTPGEARHLGVYLMRDLGQWKVSWSGSGDLPAAQSAKFGTEKRNPFQLLEDCLNNSLIRVTKDDPSGATDAQGRPKKVTDAEGTFAAIAKAGEIRKAWETWVWSDEGRTERLRERYNRRFNTLVTKTVDGSYLTLPDSAADVTLAPHQKDAVARILSAQEGTLVAHVVGAGKTYDGIAATHEAKRLGRASKPMVVVPNHLVEQWAIDFMRLYPTSRIIAMGKDDTASRESVRRFWGRVTSGDWDAVIVPESRFSQLHVTRERRIKRLEARKQTFVDAAVVARKDQGKRDMTVKQLEGVAKRAETAIKALRDGKETKDDVALSGIDFEGLGIDMLVVDEAHHFKNLGVPVAAACPGMQVASAAKCEDLLDKCEYLRETGHGSGIVFLTGTPVSNSMSELFNMEVYLAPETLHAQELDVFASWAATYGTIVATTEVKPEGNGFQVKQRFSRFSNLPELMQSVHQFADIVTNDVLSLDVPTCTTHAVSVDATSEQREAVASLVLRAERIRAGNVDPEDDNMLKITGDGRKIALDPKLCEGHEADDPIEGGKVAACARNVADIWRREAGEHGTQLVFCDTSTPASGRWNVYDDLKRRLVEAGVPEGEIAFVHDAGDNPVRRERLFEQVRKGEIRVLLGSTAKLGTGTNVQERLCAIHDLDCPWRPADLEQRLGRIVRQGNSYAHVDAYRYVTKGTFDSYAYQTVERKQRFISQVISSKSPAREADDLDETVLSYGELMAIATGDDNVRERMELENEISQMRLLRSAYASQLASVRSDVERRLEPKLDMLVSARDTAAADVELAERAVETHKSHGSSGDGRWEGITIDGVHHSERLAAVRAISAAACDVWVDQHRAIGTYGGMSVGVTCRLDDVGRERLPVRYLYVEGARTHRCTSVLPGPDVIGAGSAVSQLDRLIASIPADAERLAAEVVKTQAAIDDARATLAVPWDREGEFIDLTTRYQALVTMGEGEDSKQEDPTEGARTVRDPHAIPSTTDTFAALDRADSHTNGNPGIVPRHSVVG